MVTAQRNYDELLNLQDYELIFAARDAVIDEIRSSSSEEDLDKIPEIKFYLIAASVFDMEMQNGGLCQFLVNEGKYHGSVIENALRAYGAEQHGRIISEFCRENGIDLMNLQELVPETEDPYRASENYMQLCGKYPFSDFDKVYFVLDAECPLESILGAYIRKNIILFFGN